MDRFIAPGPLNTVPSYYYNYFYTSPDQIYAEIKEEMRSYFNTGILDDTMFSIYTDKALRKLGRVGYKIDEGVVEIHQKQGDLPSDFKFMREAWSCTNVITHFRDPSSTYAQELCVVSPYGDYDRCNPCNVCGESNLNCNHQQFIYTKQNTNIYMSFNVAHMMKPFPMNKNKCDEKYKNEGIDTFYVYDIHDNKLITNAPNGIVYITYYKEEYDENDKQLIPDNYNIQEYIKAYIKWKLYEQLYNDVTDETFNQIERKYQQYKQEYNDMLMLADAEVKKQTLYQKNLSIQKRGRRLDKYIIR